MSIASTKQTGSTEDEDKKELTILHVQDEVPRESWDKKVDFILATLGCIVGYGNFWRFPYLCYRSGGASFLIPYFIMLIFVGIPMFFMELALGQWFNSGYFNIWKAVCPLASGLGYALFIIMFLSCIYYIVILAWVFFFLFDSFRSEVPWKSCDNTWNTPFCRVKRTADQGINCTAFDLPMNCSQKFVSPSSEYWNNRVLQITGSIEEMGSMRWELVGTLLLSWVLVYIFTFKTIKLTGKIVYFTALFPLIVIFIMMIRGVTLDGAGQGIIYYLKPDFERLADPQVWVYAATQIYWSLGIGFGVLLTFGSFNSFRNNVHRDSILIAVSNCMTSVVAGFVVFSVLGFMAYFLETTVEEVAASGPGLVFIVYPEAISQMPLSVFWSIIFFFMLVTLGLDTMVGIIDQNPRKLRPRKWLIVGVLAVVIFFCGFSCVTQGGIYVFNLFDYQAAGISLLFVVLMENIFIAWIYANMIQWNGIKYDDVPYPGWAELIGWIMCLLPMLVIPTVAVYVLWKTPGSFKERWVIATTPDQQVFADIEEKHGIKRAKQYLL